MLFGGWVNERAIEETVIGGVTSVVKYGRVATGNWQKRGSSLTLPPKIDTRLHCLRLAHSLKLAQYSIGTGCATSSERISLLHPLPGPRDLFQLARLYI